MSFSSSRRALNCTKEYANVFTHELVLLGDELANFFLPLLDPHDFFFSSPSRSPLVLLFKFVEERRDRAQHRCKFVFKLQTIFRVPPDLGEHGSRGLAILRFYAVDLKGCLRAESLLNP